MPLRGESIGTAYVRVVADASGFPDDVKRQLEDEGNKFEDAGSVGAKRYKKGFEEEMQKHDSTSLDKALERALVKEDALDGFFHGEGWRKIENNFKARFGGLGEEAAAQIKEKFLKQGSLDGIENDIERVVSRVNANVDRAIAEESRAAAEAKRVMTAFESDFRSTMNETEVLSRRAADTSEEVGRKIEGVWTNIRDSFSRARIEHEQLDKRLKSGEKTVRDSATVFGRLGQTIDKMGNSVGALFGKGSRNNFLNFTGSFIGNAVKLLGVGPKILDNLAQFANGFRSALSDGESFFSAIKSGFTEMSKDAEGASTGLEGVVGSLTSLAVAAPVLVAVFAGVLTILSLVAALASGLAAAITALVSSLAFAADGLLAPIAGLVAPLGLAVGAVVAGVLAIKSNTTELKNLKAEVQPLVDVFKELGKSVDEGFFSHLHVNFHQLADDLKPLDSLAHAVGASLGNLASSLAGGFSSDGANTFFQVMSHFAPRVISALGRAVGDFAAGVGGIMIDLVPQTSRFLDWIDKIARQFHRFVAENPDKIQHFFDQAAQSLQSVGHVIGPLTKLIGTLLSSGRSTGNSIFDDLGKAISQFNDFLKAHPDGISSFFKNGKQTADDVGRVARAIIEIFNALDTPQGHKNLHDLLTVLADIGKLAGPLSVIAGLSFGQITSFFSFLSLQGREIGLAAKAIDRAAGAIKNFFHSLGGGHGGPETLTIQPPSIAWIGSVGHRLSTFFGGISHSAAAVSFESMVSHARSAGGNVVQFLASIPTRLQNLASGFGHAAAGWGTRIVQAIGSVPGRIVDVFRGLGGVIADAIGDIHLHVSVPHLPGPLQGLVDRVTASGGVFAGAQARIIGEAGPEAVVPLSGPLSAVDPSVRWLAALARGEAAVSSGQQPNNVGASRTINNEWHLVTSTADPLGVAREMVNVMAASSY